MYDCDTLHDCNIQIYSTLHLVLSLSSRPYSNDVNKQYEYLGMDKVKDIKISRNEFVKIILKCIPVIDENICNILFDYSECIGGKKNYKSFWDNLHVAVTENNIEKAEKLLKNGYYVDQWSHTGFQNPLFWSVQDELIEMTARRRLLMDLSNN